MGTGNPVPGHSDLVHKKINERKMNMKKFGKIVMLLFMVTVMSLSMTESTRANTKINKDTKVYLIKGTSEGLSLPQSGKAKVKWKSSNVRVATVSSKGKIKGLKKGTAKITATLGKKKYTAVVNVIVPPNHLTTGKFMNSTPYGAEYSSQYRFTFDKKGNVVLKGYRNKDYGTYKYINKNTIKATFTKNYTDMPADDPGCSGGYQRIKNYKYTALIYLKGDSIYVKFDKTFHKKYYSNAVDGYYGKYE